MAELTSKERFLKSLDRCSANEGFIPAFYQRLFSASDEIRQKFRHTNFDQQNRMLLRSLNLAAGATIGAPDSLRELRERAKSHDRNHLKIEATHYAVWLDSVVATAAEFDCDWSDETESDWRKILGYVVNYMVKHY